MEQNEHGLIADDAAKVSDELTRLVTEILHDIGVPAHIKGYQYLREAILLAAENMDILNEGATALYAQVAKIFQTTPSRVVRAMQHAIDVVWERADHEVIEKHCGYLGEKPGTARFVEVLADKIQEHTHNAIHSEIITPTRLGIPDIKTVKKDLEELDIAQKQLDDERNAAIIRFFNEEYGADFSEDRNFECFEDLFSETEDAGYLDPYELRLGWDEVRLFLYWQTVHDYIFRQNLTAKALEMLISNDDCCKNSGIVVADYGIEKAMEELQKIVDSAKSAMDRLDGLKQILNKYR